jgi:hypothetical protein
MALPLPVSIISPGATGFSNPSMVNIAGFIVQPAKIKPQSNAINVWIHADLIILLTVGFIA